MYLAPLFEELGITGEFDKAFTTAWALKIAENIGYSRDVSTEEDFLHDTICEGIHDYQLDLAYITLSDLSATRLFTGHLNISIGAFENAIAKYILEHPIEGAALKGE